MGIELPAELVEVAAKAGVAWPRADEDAMRASATAWREAGTRLAALAGESDGAATRALGSMSGATGDAARGHWNAFTAPDGALNSAVRGCRSAADRLDHAAEQIGAAKAELVRELVTLARNNDAAQQAATAGHPAALLGLDTAVRGAATNVAHLTDVLTNAVRLDSGVTVGGSLPPVDTSPGVHGPGGGGAGPGGPGDAPGQGGDQGRGTQSNGGGLPGGGLLGGGALVDGLLGNGSGNGSGAAGGGGSGGDAGGNRAPGLVGGLLGGVADTVGAVADPLVDAVGAVAPPVAAVVDPLVDTAKDVVRGAGDTVDQALPGPVGQGQGQGPAGQGPGAGQGPPAAAPGLVNQVLNPVDHVVRPVGDAVGGSVPGAPVVDAVGRPADTVGQSAAAVLDRPVLPVDTPHAPAQQSAAPAANQAAPQGPSFGGTTGGAPGASPAAGAAATQSPAANAGAQASAQPGQAAPKAEARAAQAAVPTQGSSGQGSPGQGSGAAGPGQGSSAQGSAQGQNQGQNQGQDQGAAKDAGAAKGEAARPEAQAKTEAPAKADTQAKADVKGEAKAESTAGDLREALITAARDVEDAAQDGSLAFAVVPIPVARDGAARTPLLPGPAPTTPPARRDEPAPDPVPAASTARPSTEAVALFLAHMFPGGTLPRPRTAPVRQLPPPSGEQVFAAGLRFEPGGHPDRNLVDTSAQLGLDLTYGDLLRSRLSGAAGDPAAEPRPAVARPRLVLAPGAAPDPALLVGHDPQAGMHERDWDRRFLVRSDPPEYAWPPGELFPEGGYEAGQPGVLAVGVELDRFGPAEGRVLAESGTAYAARSLPPALLDAGHHRYRVARVLPVWFTLSAGWFGQPGGGVRYRTTHPVADLLALGYLEEVR
ncbi:TNT domain-containing protein [Saccharothrix lopnurensis]|uniref:TNT domain-containing protein n=1 Tax=Saccharothrix lopnurensis TaxID=1670621 RepID=A0ABW1P1Y9_9PSEU